MIFSLTSESALQCLQEKNGDKAASSLQQILKGAVIFSAEKAGGVLSRHCQRAQ